MNNKDFFSKLASVGPDGKFMSYKNNDNRNENKNENNNENYNKKMHNNIKQKSDEIRQQEVKSTTVVDDEEEGQLAVDVYATPSMFVIESVIAGVKSEDIDVAITIDSVTISGKRTKDDRDSEREYLCQECFWGKFSRTIILPSEIDSEHAIASFKNGILRVTLHKILRDKPKKLKIRFD